jgi:hypothetical protein
MAAIYVSGHTLHSIFRIPNSTPTALNAGNVQTLQADFHDVKYLIIDEGAMLGSVLEFWMDQCCREIFPSRQGMLFRGDAASIVR